MATFLELCARILTEDNFVMGSNTQQNNNQPQNNAQKPAVPANNTQPAQQQNQQTPQQNNQQNQQNKPAPPVKMEDLLKKDLSNHPMSKDPNVQKALQQIVDTYNKSLTNNNNAANK